MRASSYPKQMLTALVFLSGLVLVWPGHAAPALRVAVLVSQGELPYEQVIQGLREQLQESGLPVEPEVEYLQGDPARAVAIVQWARSEARVLITLGALATQTAVREVPHTPLVSALVLNADELHGHSKVTGVALEFSTETELRWMQRVLPEIRRVGVLFSPAQNQQRITRAVSLARELGFELHARTVLSPRDLPDNLALLADHADVLWGISDTVVLTPQTAQTLLLFSFRNQIPFVGLSRSWVKAGALFALERDYVDIGRQSGELATQILKGAAPQSLPVQSPRKVGVVLNLKTARQLKIEFPPAIRQASLDVVE